MNIPWFGILGKGFFSESEKHMELKYQRFDAWRHWLEKKNYIPDDIKQKLILFIDNILDFENVTLGVAFHKREKYLEKVKEVYDSEFKMCFSITQMILDLIYLPKVYRYDDTHRLLLDIGIEHSEILQSYADTLDVLTNDD